MSGELSPTTLRQALEEALVENPDDLAAHMAYADHLMEQGDPRGEFIQVQLALGITGKTTTQRDSLQHREQELALAHHREWLGTLAPLLLGEGGQVSHLFQVYGVEGPHGSAAFARGWLDRLHIKALTPQLVVALSVTAATQVCLLRHLHIDSCPYFAPMSKARCLRNVRVFRLGAPQNSVPWVVDTIRHMPRLEELHLQATGYSVIDLLRLPVMENVRVLTLTGMTDLACQWLGHAGVLQQLRVLDLSDSLITDQGARFLASAPDLGRLDCLDVQGTEIGRQGWQRLFGVLGSKLRSDYAPDPGDVGLFEIEDE
jgi:uncharacterized protein (TIGR02996 family)